MQGLKFRGVCALLAMLVLSACGKPEVSAPAPRPVLVEAPQPLNGESGEVFPGTVRAREEADLAFRVPGKILSRRVEAGQQVKAGDVLASLDPQDATLNLHAAEAAAAAAEADMKLAESELTRHKDLLDKGFISKSLYDVRENSLRLAQARHQQAQAQVAVVRNQSRYTTLTADKSGLVTAVLAEAGQVVAAGQPVFRLAAGNEREVIIHVPEGRVEALRKADKLTISLWAQAEKHYPARLREVNLQADRSTRTHEARITLLNGDAAVQLGMTATVVLGARVDAGAFIVPLSALGGTQEQAAVWIVGEDNMTHPVPVKVLRYVEQGAVIAGALNAQMKMVTAGTHLMVDGASVIALERKRKS